MPMPTYEARPRPPPDRARKPTATTTTTAVAPGSVKSKVDVEAAKRKKADESAAAAAQVGFGGGDPWSTGENVTFEDFFSRFGPGYMDQTQAGQFQEAMGGSMQQPGMGEQQIQGSLGKFNMPSASEKQYAAAQGAGLDPYYDRAREETMASMDQALAARGAFGSSMGIGQIGSAMSQLGAEQANREADFMQKAAQQADQQKIARLGMGGQLAIGGQQVEQGRFATGLQGAMGADAMAQAQFSTGANTAMAVQSAKQGRIQDWLGNVMKTSGEGADQVASAWENMTGADREMFEQQMMMELGISKEQLNQLLSNQAQSRENFDQVMSAVGEAAEAGGNVATGIAGGAGGGGGGYNPNEARR